MKTLGENIKTIRIAKSMTQEDMAHEMDITISAYSRIERNLTDVNYSRLEQIATIFKIPVAQIISLETIDVSNKEIEKLKKTIEAKDKEIMMLQKEVIRLMKGKR